MNLLIIGPRGKMGRLITKFAYENENINIIGGICPKNRDYIGKDIGIITSLSKEIGALVYDDIESIIDKCDVIVDYTHPAVSMDVFKYALKYKKAIVCGTTGFTNEEHSLIKEYSKQIPILFAANTSKIVNLVYNLLEIISKSIGKESDIEIIEMHDKFKKDAPSGTSKEMGEIIAKSLNYNLKDLAVYVRHGLSDSHNQNIAFHSIRSGDISSSHTVMFGLMGERLEITHHAYNWDCFARGACDCINYIYNKPAGYYSVSDVLNI